MLSQNSNGGGDQIDGRARWYGNKRNEWDYQHGKLETFDKSGKKHLDEYDGDGAQTKPQKPGPTTPKG
ncbi:colicin E3/pyocin S6 family cytotoxin [Rhizobium leguminosarum]|uniref:colicin E3/pyocin S6 family cytotoxin n=1 Tax=Rhizobium leguminosarum TaxID=384 RepID=UPI003D7C280F